MVLKESGLGWVWVWVGFWLGWVGFEKVRWFVFLESFILKNKTVFKFLCFLVLFGFPKVCWLGGFGRLSSFFGNSSGAVFSFFGWPEVLEFGKLAIFLAFLLLVHSCFERLLFFQGSILKNLGLSRVFPRFSRVFQVF